MLARSTLVGMQEPQSVGRVKSIVPTSFLCRNESNQKLIKAESGSKEANDKVYEKIYSCIANYLYVYGNEWRVCF